MTDWSHLRDFRVVRLNARLSPVSPLEAKLYDRYGLRPVLAEANSVAELISVLADCDALFAVSVALPAPVIASLHRCKLISRLGNGTDKIDVAEATRRGILVTNVPYFCVDEMADHAMGLLLMLARRIPQMSRYMLAGAYPQARPNRSNCGACRTACWGLSALALRAKRWPSGRAPAACAYWPRANGWPAGRRPLLLGWSW
jgi:phosphoglycerate dehydrogenase-like enzyme